MQNIDFRNIPNLPAPRNVEVQRYYLRAATPNVHLEVLECRPEKPLYDGSVLFVHGQWSNAATPKNLMLELKKQGISSVSFSAQGCGLSGESAPLNLSKDRDDLLAVIKQLAARGLEKITLLGHSYGGFVAQSLLGNDYTPQVERLILANSIPPQGSFEGNLRFMKIAGIRAGEVYINSRGEIPRSVAEKVLFNDSGIPEGLVLDRGRRISNAQAVFPVSDLSMDTIRERHGKTGRLLVITGEKDMLFADPRGIVSAYQVPADQCLALNTDHMGILFGKANTAAELIARNLLTTL